MTIIIPLILIYLVVLLAYFRIAKKFDIVDKPNARSSHQRLTIRGAGILIPVSATFWFFSSHFQNPFFFSGLFIISIISFLDDLYTIKPVYRFIIHIIGFVLLTFDLPEFSFPITYLILTYLAIFVIGIGALNAFNFMDGINGITGIYALVTLSSVAFVEVSFLNSSVNAPTMQLILFVGISILVFLYYNFRRIAFCFAGDVGSVSLAFIQIYLVLRLILITGRIEWILFFLVFGIDSVLTIIYRIKRSENIFKPHRTHLYQFLVNELGFSHQLVSFVYGLIQIVLNCILISSEPLSVWQLLIFILIPGFVYLLVRWWVLKRHPLKA